MFNSDQNHSGVFVCFALLVVGYCPLWLRLRHSTTYRNCKAIRDVSLKLSLSQALLKVLLNGSSHPD
jgi:hypothetical protein